MASHRQHVVTHRHRWRRLRPVGLSWAGRESCTGALAENCAESDGCPLSEVGGQPVDAGFAEAVGVVVLGVLVACGGEVGGKLAGGDDRLQVVRQGGEQTGGCPAGLAEQDVDVEVVAGGSAVVEGLGLGCDGVGQVNDGGRGR